MTRSAALSLVPNSATMTSLEPGGARSITAAPTAATGDGAPEHERGDELADGERGAGGDDPRRPPRARASAASAGAWCGAAAVSGWCRSVIVAVIRPAGGVGSVRFMARLSRVHR